MQRYSLAIIAIIAILAAAGLGQEPIVPGNYPSFTVTAELDTIWIGQEGFAATDSSAFDRLAWEHWYPVFAAYNDKTASFRIVKDLQVLAEYQDKSRPTCTDLNDYSALICRYLADTDWQIRINWGEYCLYNGEN